MKTSKVWMFLFVDLLPEDVVYIDQVLWLGDNVEKRTDAQGMF